MGNMQSRPILITGGGRRIGLALAHHFLTQQQPVILSYRTPVSYTHLTLPTICSV